MKKTFSLKTNFKILIYILLPLFVLVFIVSLLGIVLLKHCLPKDDDITYTDIPEVRAELISGIDSYQSVNLLVEYFEQKGYSGEVTGALYTIYNSSKGPFEHHQIVIPIYEHLGFNGKLELDFFNDRLLCTTFDPEDLNAYATVLLDSYGTDIEKVERDGLDSSANVFDFSVRTEIYISKYTVSWTDKLLQSEYSLRGLLYSDANKIELFPISKF